MVPVPAFRTASEIPGREAPHLGDFVAQVFGQAVDDLRTPALLLLAGEPVPAAGPVEEDQLRVDRESRTGLSRADAPFEVFQKIGVVVKRNERGCRSW